MPDEHDGAPSAHGEVDQHVSGASSPSTLSTSVPPSSVGVGLRIATLVVTAVIRLFCVGAVALFWADRYMMVGIES